MEKRTGLFYRVVASLIDQHLRCIDTGPTEWEQKTGESLEYLEKNVLPSGSGIDCGTKFDLVNSTGQKIVMTFEYHFMNETGMYDGWGDYKLVIRPDLMFGCSSKITGRDRDGIKDYLYEVFDFVRDEFEFSYEDGVICGTENLSLKKVLEMLRREKKESE